MSAGAFQVSKYQADNTARIYPVKIQPESAALAVPTGTPNNPPAGATTEPTFARARKNRAAYGVGCRQVGVRFTATLPTGYLANQVYRIPILTPAYYASINPGATGTYLGQAVVVVSKYPETLR